MPEGNEHHTTVCLHYPAVVDGTQRHPVALRGIVTGAYLGLRTELCCRHGWPGTSRPRSGTSETVRHSTSSDSHTAADKHSSTQCFSVSHECLRVSSVRAEP